MKKYVLYTAIFFYAVVGHDGFILKKNSIYKRDGKKIVEKLIEFEQTIPHMIENVAKIMRLIHKEIDLQMSGDKNALYKTKNNALVDEVDNLVTQLFHTTEIFNSQIEKINIILHKMRHE